jgi:hypothetical protein
MIVATNSLKTLVCAYQTARCHVAEQKEHDTLCHKHLESNFDLALYEKIKWLPECHDLYNLFSFVYLFTILIT